MGPDSVISRSEADQIVEEAFSTLRKLLPEGTSVAGSTNDES